MGEFIDNPEPIHTWFGLSYANYLVLPRTVLQSMPQEWQSRFVEMLDELVPSFDHVEFPFYDVRVLARQLEMIFHEECKACDGEGEIDDKECEECLGNGMIEIDPRYETAEEVGVIEDPIPFYNRGRARIPLRKVNGEAERN